MKRICFLDRDTFATHLDLRRPNIAHQWDEHNITNDGEQIRARLQQADIVVVNKVPLTQETIIQLPKLQMVALTATGFNNIDIEACQKQGVSVCNIRDYATTTLAEHTLALFFALTRSITSYHQSVMQGAWSQAAQFCYFDYPIGDLAGKSLCIIGKGNLGSAVARKAEVLGMRVIFAEHACATQVRAGYTPFYHALAEADIVSLHCPLNKETEKLLGEKEFAHMKPTAFVVNTARGALIDELALVNALDTGALAGAALDVLVVEPPPADHPLLQPRHNVIVTPHIAWASDHGQLAAWEQTMENIEAWAAGTPIRQLV